MTAIRTIINKKTLLGLTLVISACVSKPEPYPTSDADWDYVFGTDEQFGDYCKVEYEADCVYYPPYY